MTSEKSIKQDIELILSTYANRLKEQSRFDILSVIANAEYSISQVEYDQWDGGQYGYRITFNVPSAVFARIADQHDEIETTIDNDLNQLAFTYEHDYFSSVRIIEQLVYNPTWREDSGTLLADVDQVNTVAKAEQKDLLWGDGCFRLFISHRAEHKTIASSLKLELARWQMASFVAHEDIEPNSEWQDEIIKALFSMDALLALMDENFHTSYWTDQEIGVAIGRRRAVISANLGQVPYGFIGKLQAIPVKIVESFDLAIAVIQALYKNPSLQLKLNSCIVKRFTQSRSFEEAKRLVVLLKQIKSLSSPLISELEAALLSNSQIFDAYGVPVALNEIVCNLKDSR
ncbi:toll/interleukin-1 receptor domain-containing protein [bacterium]|nr:toll/interleukin-1 receptor domain-containing protein [bacterium]